MVFPGKAKRRMALSPAEKQKRYRERKDGNAVTVTRGNGNAVTRRSARGMVSDERSERDISVPIETPRARHDHGECHKELAMLRLDVERLKGELAAARVVPGDWRSRLPQVARLDYPMLPKDAVCGGPGKCGTLTCRHPGW